MIAPDLSTPEAVAHARAGEVLVSRDALAKLVNDPYYYQEHEREEGELDASLCFGCNAPEHEPHFPDCPVPTLAAALAAPCVPEDGALDGLLPPEPGHTTYTLTTAILRNRYIVSSDDAIVAFDFTCPFVPFIGLEVSALDGEVSGIIARAWWDSDAGRLSLETKAVQPPEQSEAEFSRAIREFLRHGYRPISTAARREADLMASEAPNAQ